MMNIVSIKIVVIYITIIYPKVNFMIQSMPFVTLTSLEKGLKNEIMCPNQWSVYKMSQHGLMENFWYIFSALDGLIYIQVEIYIWYKNYQQRPMSTCQV